MGNTKLNGKTIIGVRVHHYYVRMINTALIFDHK